MSLNDGGQLSVGDAVYWTGAYPSGATVRVEFSSDSGGSWNAVASNLLASSGRYIWVSTNFSSSTFARYRVVLEATPSVLDGNDINFTFRNGPFRYFINDTNSVGDVYCNQLGNDANTGSSSNAPKATLANLLGDADLEPGDVVYIDSGHYLLASSPQITSADSGSATQLVQFTGSPVAGRTVFNRQGGSGTDGLLIGSAPFIEISNILFTNAAVGVRVENSQGVRLTRLGARNMTDSGYVIRNSPNSQISESYATGVSSNGVLVETSTGVVLRGSVVYGAPVSGVRVLSGRLAISNSSVSASSSDSLAFWIATPTNLVGNFNNYHAVSGAFIGYAASLDEYCEVPCRPGAAGPARRPRACRWIRSLPTPLPRTSI